MLAIDRGFGTNPIPSPKSKEKTSPHNLVRGCQTCRTYEGGLDIPALSFGIEHVEREHGLAEDSRYDDELVPGDRDADIFEVVLAGTFDDDIFHFWWVQIGGGI